MIAWAGDSIISSLGFTTEECYRSVASGQSGIRLYSSFMGLPEPQMASLIDRERLADSFAADSFAAVNPCSGGYTALEKAAILSVGSAAAAAQVDLSDPDVLFVFSSTKGNVHLLDEGERQAGRDHIYLWYVARLIAEHFKNPNEPVAVSNACISGACAQLVAMRELESGQYGCAVVVGVEMLSKFIVSGFQSLKALSPEPCRPFDAARAGLNLGEAAATIVYRRVDSEDEVSSGIALQQGAIRNDANHISGPSRTGEGSFRALQALLRGVAPGDVAFINAHGTATAYNDDMEATAITRAGLQATPVNSLKGYFGHTLGAAGVLESIISARALANGTALATHGFKRGEKEPPVNVTDKNTHTEKAYCIKMLSGFGGCNAALLFKYVKEKSNTCRKP
ncbi:MAG: beta-ketoacyl synthase [Prevotellaceae bacterium]|jgi:3-oxoacyl-[acyl-carrier-protein] synthase-1|nr:beta-ketoacyl synthase [Prevotellaceae bacterium]